MGKVMISLPDHLLASLDAEASRRGMTRSGLLRSYVDEALRRRAVDRPPRIDLLMRGAGCHGGDSAATLKQHRPHWG